MKPARVFLFLLVAFLALGLLSWFFPPDGIRLGPSLHIRFPSLRNYLCEIISQAGESEPSAQVSFRPDTSFVFFPGINRPADIAGQGISDSTLPEDTGEQKDPLPDHIPSFLYPPEGDTLLFPFFRKLEKVRTRGGSVHILHYGDSQIEGDRISSFLREKWQSVFGGGGPGAFPATPVVDETVSYRLRHSDNWKRTVFPDLVDSTRAARRLGFLMSADRIQTDSAKAQIILEWYPRARAHAKKFERAGFVYGQAADSFSFRMVINGEASDTCLVPPSENPRRISIPVKATETGRVEFEIFVQKSPVFYAFFLENTTGVQVHNIPVRGSAGLEFSRVNTGVWKESMEGMETGLLILQFGINLIPGWNNQYAWYLDRLTRELHYLKSRFPSMPVLVIGVSDMARPGMNGPEPYPGVGEVRQAQCLAAMEAGCIFWDGCEAMGGPGSVVEWAHSDPPLARTDYTHFTYAGSRLFAVRLFEAFQREYMRYLSGNQYLE